LTAADAIALMGSVHQGALGSRAAMYERKADLGRRCRAQSVLFAAERRVDHHPPEADGPERTVPGPGQGGEEVRREVLVADEALAVPVEEQAGAADLVAVPGDPDVVRGERADVLVLVRLAPKENIEGASLRTGHDPLTDHPGGAVRRHVDGGELLLERSAMSVVQPSTSGRGRQGRTTTGLQPATATRVPSARSESA
jgi:hypothetical protein